MDIVTKPLKKYMINDLANIIGNYYTNLRYIGYGRTPKVYKLNYVACAQIGDMIHIEENYNFETKKAIEKTEKALKFMKENNQIHKTNIILRNNINERLRKGLNSAATYGYLGIVQYFMERVYIYLSEALRLSVLNGHLEVVKHILSSKKGWRSKDEKLNLSLFHACVNNQKEILEYLDGKVDYTKCAFCNGSKHKIEN